MSNAGRLVALSLLAFPLGAVAANSALSFTAHSLNVGSSDSVSLLALDSLGDAYVVGTVMDSSGVARAQITKTDSAGKVVASYRFGIRESVSAICVDHTGAVIVAGQGFEADFPSATSFGTATASPVAFVAKLDSTLPGITASAVIGGNQTSPYMRPSTAASSVAVDASDNVYIDGLTAVTDFPVSAGAYQSAPTTGAGFLAELSSNFDKIVFATYYSGNRPNSLTHVAVDSAGSIICIGVYDLPVSVGTTPADARVAEIVKFAAGGGSVLWTATLRPAAYGGETVAGLAFDSSDNVVAVGNAWTGLSATAGAVQSCDSTTSSGGFVAKLSGSSGAIQFLTYFGCLSDVWTTVGVNSVALDASGAIWITGTAPSPSSLPPAAISSGSGTTYLAELAADGSTAEALYLGPAGLLGQGVGLTPAGNPVVLGTAGLLMLTSADRGPSLLGGVANAAGSAASGLIAPAEIVSFYGSALGPAAPLDAQIVNGVVQSTLGGYQLLFGGVAAPLLYIGANQINAIVPNEVSGQDSVSVTLVTPSGSFPVADLYVRPSEPEIFHDPVSGYAVAINQDDTLNSSTNLARAGQLVSIWGTGSGEAFSSDFPADGAIIADTSSIFTYPQLAVSVLARYQNPLGVFIGESLEVAYAGISPGEVFGLLQVNFRIPEALPSSAASSGSLYVSLQIGSAASGWVPIHVAP
jgi:uncharacterized protein (TIGR03437 family)